MLERIRRLRERHIPLRQFEIKSPLSIEECLIRLTGRHPPFGKSERIARPQPFQGEVDATSISIVTKVPYELSGEIARAHDWTRFSFQLSYVEPTGIGSATSPCGVILLSIIAYNLGALAWMAISEESARDIALFALLVGIGIVALASAIGRALDRRHLLKLRESAPDVADTVQILANLVLATGVRETPITDADEPVNKSLGNPV